MRLFIPAWDGLEGFIGPYGESVIDDPTPEQAKFLNKKYGAREYIESTLNTYLEDGSPAAMQKYYTFKELHPTCYADCFRVTDGNIGFNIQQLDEGIKFARNNQSKVLMGDFEWENGIFGSKVGFYPNENGRWEVSHQMRSEFTNRKVMGTFKDNTNHWYPEDPEKYTAGGDPFQFLTEIEYNKRKGSTRLSDGGGAIYRERDKKIDPDEKPIKEHVTGNFVATYKYRTADDDDYCEDMLKACIYYGAMMYPEMNLKILYKYFYKKGYAGYLKYGYDIATGKINDLPGASTLGANKEELFKAVKHWINWRAHTCLHEGLLKEFKKIKRMEELTRYDLFAAAGYALLGSLSSFSSLIKDTTNQSIATGVKFVRARR